MCTGETITNYVAELRKQYATTETHSIKISEKCGANAYRPAKTEVKLKDAIWISEYRNSRGEPLRDGE